MKQTKKTLVSMLTLLCVTGSAFAADYYDVRAFSVVDQTGSLSVRDRVHLNRAARPYAGGRMSESDMNRLEDELERYLDSAYGRDVYDVAAADRTRSGRLDLYVRYDDNRRAHAKDAKDQNAPAYMILEFEDETNSLTETQRSDIRGLLGRYTAGDTTAKLAEKARQSVQHYLDRAYGSRHYRVETKWLASNAYRIIVRDDKNYRDMQREYYFSADYDLRDFSGQLTHRDQWLIAERIQDATDGLMTGTNEERFARRYAAAAKQAVAEYLDQTYGRDHFDVDVVRVQTGHKNRFEFRIDVKAKQGDRQKVDVIFELRDRTLDLTNRDRSEIRRILDSYATGRDAERLAQHAAADVERYLERAYRYRDYDVSYERVNAHVYRIEIESDRADDRRPEWLDDGVGRIIWDILEGVNGWPGRDRGDD